MITEFLNDKITISLDEFIKTITKKWKMVIIIAIVFSAVFACVSYTIGEEISEPASEEYIYWEKNLENVRSYRENSILMQMNPMEIYQKTIFLTCITDEELLKNYITSTDVWNDVKTERNKMYAGELITWNMFEGKDTVEVVLQHVTEKECAEWMAYLKEKIWEFDEDVLIVEGASSIVTDEKVLALQQKKYADIEFAEQLLDESQAAYTIEVSVELAACIGIVVGLMISCLVIMLQMIINRGNRG